MNQRQQQLIDELVKEFDKLNSSNQKKGRLLDVSAYIDEFNQSEVMRKEIEAYNNAKIIEAKESFLEEAKLLQCDLSDLGIETFIHCNNFNDHELIFKVPGYGDKRIFIKRRLQDIALPNGNYIEKTIEFVVRISDDSFSTFDSVQELVNKSDHFKLYVRRALQ
jgi:hypothetical protein